MAGTHPELRLSEVLAALSRALDLADGHSIGHAVRTCLVGMRLADELQLEPDDRSALFYALLLKDAGCSSNAAKLAALYRTDDHEAKRNVKLVDHKRLPEAVGYIWRNVGGGSTLARLRNAVRVGVVGPRIAREMTEIRCERGAAIARKLEFPAATADAIRTLDEHWDGRGHPARLAGEEIPLLGRILGIAQTVEVFASHAGPEAAFAVAEARSGRWFDPDLVRALASLRGDELFWASLPVADERRAAALEPERQVVLADDERLDRVAEAFALIIDVKSPYTFRHSERVAELAVATGGALGLQPDALGVLRRAGLLHDIGKLGVSNLILDKPGRLTDDELAAVRRHPSYTQEILARISAFSDLAEVAASHHEKLDGSGYHRGVRAADLPLAARILAVADIHEALTAERPYREALSAEQALELMAREAGATLCPLALSGLEEAVSISPLRAAA